MAREKQYRGMSLTELGGYVATLFTYELGRNAGSDLVDKPEDAAMKGLLQAAFLDMFPEGPVILGLAGDMISGKRDGKNPVSRFEKAVSQLGDLISSTCATILTSGADMNEEELIPLYPAIGQAFVACCELFPEDPEEEGYLYEWEFPNGYGEEDGEYALFFQAADEALEEATDAVLRADTDAGLALMDDFEEMGAYDNRTEDPELWEGVVECLSMLSLPEGFQGLSEEGDGEDVQHMLSIALNEMHPDFAEYFVNACGRFGDDKILPFPGFMDPEEKKRNDLIRLLEKTYLDTMLEEVFAGYPAYLETMKEKTEEPVIRHVLFFYLIGILLFHGYEDDEEDWDDEDFDFDDDDDDEDDDF